MNDLISRESAIDAVAKALKGTFVEYEDIAEKIINKVPSVQPEDAEKDIRAMCGECDAWNIYKNYPQNYSNPHCFPGVEETSSADRPTGEWIIKDNPGTGWYRVTCSECGEDVTSTAPCIGFYPNAKVMWDFCPNCGSYNGGEQSEND